MLERLEILLISGQLVNISHNERGYLMWRIVLFQFILVVYYVVLCITSLPMAIEQTLTRMYASNLLYRLPF